MAGTTPTARKLKVALAVVGAFAVGAAIALLARSLSTDTQDDPNTTPGANSPASPTEPPQQVAAGSVNLIRVADGETWATTNCSLFGADNVWHADTSDLPGEPLSEFPIETVSGVRPQPYDPLQLDSGFPVLDSGGEVRNPGKAITFIDSSDPVRTITIDGETWFRESEYTSVNAPGARANSGVIDQPVPEDGVALQLTSTDDHALFVDTDRCTTYEHLGWDRVPGANKSTVLSVFDLNTNYRRLSSKPDWLNAPTNSADGSIESEVGDVSADTPGMNGIDMAGARGAAGATSGSGLSSVAGLVRVDELFANPTPGDRTLDPAETIDHAIAAVLPAWYVQGMPKVASSAPAPFVWPATRSDGCAGEGTIACSIGPSDDVDQGIPMGARLRLGESACQESYSAQAQRIVDALCTYGVMIIDSSDHFSLNIESSNKWDPEARNELAGLHLSDFEIVDTKSALGDTLWDSAREWAASVYGEGANLQGGWYVGAFWGQLLRSPDANSSSGLTAEQFGETFAAVNSADWLLYPDR